MIPIISKCFYTVAVGDGYIFHVLDEWVILGRSIHRVKSLIENRETKLNIVHFLTLGKGVQLLHERGISLCKHLSHTTVGKTDTKSGLL